MLLKLTGKVEEEVKCWTSLIAVGIFERKVSYFFSLLFEEEIFIFYIFSHMFVVDAKL